MDKRIEAFLRDVLALEGKHSNLAREGVRARLAKCERQFRKDEENESMRNRAAEMCDRLCRARIVEEMRQRRGDTNRCALEYSAQCYRRAGAFPIEIRIAAARSTIAALQHDPETPFC